MRTKVISADTIDAAVDKILIELEADTGSGSSSRENAIYFDGWDGLGASAVLQAVAERLAISNEPATKLAFDKVINIDCSKWESRRAVQRKIAEQLKLPNWVTEMFDKQDEEDDFDGLDKCSHGVIAEVVTETYQTVKNSRFIVILHNGSDEEMRMSDFGLHLDPLSRSKILWTFQGRYWLDPSMTDKVAKSTTTNVLLSAASRLRDIHKLWPYLVYHEAAQLPCNNCKHGDGEGIIDPAIAVECFMYMLKQCSISSHVIDYDWAIHTSNYWICDGIIPPAQLGAEIEETDMPWEYGDALQQEIRLNTDKAKEGSTLLHPQLTRSTEQIPYWFSTVTSGFVLSPSGVISSNTFQHSDRLRVLKISGCTFSFSSPPFLCCHNLRFLWLDHCQDLLTRRSTVSSDNHHTDTDADKEVGQSWECFQSLWVLDLRYTDWDRILSAQVMDIMTQLRELNVMGANSWNMSHIRGRLRNICKFRVTKSTCRSDDDNLFPEMESMELLDFSGNHMAHGMTSLYAPARSSSRLKSVIIDGCHGLETISLRGCKELEDVLLKGLFKNLGELDLSGTSVKTLNLREVDTPALKRLILLGCEKLRAILWPPVEEYRVHHYVMRIDTTSTSASAQHAHPVHGDDDRSLQQQKEEKFNQWQISLADARLLRSLGRAIYQLGYPSLHIDICPGGGSCRDKLVQVTSTSSSMVDSNYNRDDVRSEMMMMMWDCPEIPLKPSATATCIIKVMTQGQGSNKVLVEDAQGVVAATTSTALLSSRAICYVATSLHVYDDSSITSIYAPPIARSPLLRNLMWCRVERCPKLHTLFAAPEWGDYYDFRGLKTFWGSQLLTARYIWKNTLYSIHNYNLAFLHLDYCPRLIHVLPFFIPMGETTFRYLLETLEIVCCGDLRVVFPIVPAQDTRVPVAVKNKVDIPGDLREVFPIVLAQHTRVPVAVKNKVDFPRLRRIHLHELPMLQHICPCTMSAPNLETIVIKGCWRLRRLPAIGSDTQPPMVDCEKEWWDRLEWDGVEAYHHPSLYRPIHSLHYKNA